MWKNLAVKADEVAAIMRQYRAALSAGPAPQKNSGADPWTTAIQSANAIPVRSSLVVLLALLMAAVCPPFSQMAAASLFGYVTDPSGAVMTNVSVQVVNGETNVSQRHAMQ